MTQRNAYTIFVCLLLALVFASCGSTHRITHRSQLTDPTETGTITVLTTDTTLYTMRVYRVSDSLLEGRGYSEKNGKRNEFSGQLKISEIIYIHATTNAMSTGNVVKALALAGVVVLFANVAESAIGGKSGFRADEERGHYSPYTSSPGSSCPFLYSWNGESYVLDAEAIGTAFGKGLEMQTGSVLPSLTEDGSGIRVRIANERPETHYLNFVQLRAIETEADDLVVLDAQNRAWTVRQQTPPASAVDHSRNDILQRINQRDGNYWESDLTTASVHANFEDVLDMTFAKPSGTREGSLVVHGINTNITNSVFQTVFDFFGDQSLLFVHAVDQDAEMISLLKKWKQEASIKAFVLDNTEWKEIGVIFPEASVAPFSRLIRFNLGEYDGDSVKIRLIFMTDVWKIDAVQIDWTPAEQLASQAVALQSAIGPGNKDMSSVLCEADSKYAVLLPPECVDLTFQAVAPSPGKKIVYALNLQGYLYEWIHERDTLNPFVEANLAPKDGKVEYVKNVLRYKEIFLPIVYANWKRMKQSLSEGRNQ